MLIVRSRNVVLPEETGGATIHIGADGKIIDVLPYDAKLTAARVIDAGDLHVLPGLVDTHIAAGADFAALSRDAAAGGFTTIIDTALDPAARAQGAEGRAWVDFGFWAGVVPDGEARLEPAVDAGALGFKASLMHSTSADFPLLRETDLARAMERIAKLEVPVLVHAEIEGPAPAPEGMDDLDSYRRYLAARPRAWENRAVKKLIDMADRHGCHVHVSPLSSCEALPDLAKARRRNIPITIETCPHYLILTSEDAQVLRVAPPIRERSNCEDLWDGLQSGVIDFIVSGGVAPLALTLPLIWTEAQARGFSESDVAWWLSAGPAAFAGLAGRKGLIEPGMDGDLVIWNPEETFTVGDTPGYAGRELSGRVVATFLRGRNIYDRGALSPTPLGEQVERE